MAPVLVQQTLRKVCGSFAIGCFIADAVISAELADVGNFPIQFVWSSRLLDSIEGRLRRVFYRMYSMPKDGTLLHAHDSSQICISHNEGKRAGFF